MNAGDLVNAIVTVLLGGGLGAGAASLITGRAIARKTGAEARGLDAKLPAEVDSVAVQGAETAVLTMDRALKSATERISHLELEREADRKANAKEREADRRTIANLQRQVDDLTSKVEHAEKATSEAKAAGDALRRELNAFVIDRDGRKKP